MLVKGKKTVVVRARCVCVCVCVCVEECVFVFTRLYHSVVITPGPLDSDLFTIEVAFCDPLKWTVVMNATADQWLIAYMS